MNKSVAARSPWLAFLKQRGTFGRISKELKEAAAEYRKTHPPSPKAKTAAEKRLVKLQRAIEAVQDANIQNRLGSEFGDRYSADYVDAVVKRL
jgi:transposase